jgi:hypothetical protein
MHDQVLYILRIDGHYDAIFASGAEHLRCNASYLKGGEFAEYGNDLEFNRIVTSVEDPSIEL